MENEEISPEIFFENDMVCENKQITDLSGEENIFLYGTGGIGKTTTLLRNSQLLKENICFYFPLYRYREETITAYDNINCRILIRILLRYIYQDEYPSFELLFISSGNHCAYSFKSSGGFLLLSAGRPYTI